MNDERPAAIASLLSMLWTSGPGCTRPGRTESLFASSRAPESLTVRLTNTEVGYTLSYPGDWHVGEQVVATDFAGDAQCDSVEIVDAGSPPGAGAVVRRSFVQICSRRITDGSSLDDFMRRTYDEAARAGFHATEIGGAFAYETTNDGSARLLFLQTPRHRLEIVTAVMAGPDRQPRRVAQVQEMLKSISFRAR